MHYKAKVLALYPDACLQKRLTYNFGGFVHHYIAADGGTKSLDIHPDACIQGATAAWRSAYYWTVRNPKSIARTKAEAAGFEVIGGGIHWLYRSKATGAADDAQTYRTEGAAWRACADSLPIEEAT